MDKNYQYFMKEDMSPYLDEWVAICDEEIVTHGKDFTKVIKIVQKKYPKKVPFIAKVPGNECLIL